MKNKGRKELLNPYVGCEYQGKNYWFEFHALLNNKNGKVEYIMPSVELKDLNFKTVDIWDFDEFLIDLAHGYQCNKEVKKTRKMLGKVDYKHIRFLLKDMIKRGWLENTSPLISPN